MWINKGQLKNAILFPGYPQFAEKMQTAITVVIKQ